MTARIIVMTVIAIAFVSLIGSALFLTHAIFTSDTRCDAIKQQILDDPHSHNPGDDVRAKSYFNKALQECFVELSGTSGKGGEYSNIFDSRARMIAGCAGNSVQKISAICLDTLTNEYISQEQFRGLQKKYLNE